MAAETLLAQVKGLELQLTVLKAQVKRAGAAKPGLPFSRLEGLLAGTVQSTEHDIAGVEYRPKWKGRAGAGE